MSTDASNRRVLVKSLFGAAGMFAFAIFVLPPMYDLFCEITGLGGKTGDAYTAVDVRVDTSREVRVRFVASNNASMPWIFKPAKDSVVVHPGEPTEITYLPTTLLTKIWCLRRYRAWCRIMWQIISTRQSVSVLRISLWQQAIRQTLNLYLLLIRICRRALIV